MKVLIVLIGAVLIATGCCQKLKDDAEELVNKHEQCSAGDTCTVVQFNEIVGANNCLGPFQCAGALNEKGLSSFISEAKDIAGDFKHCNECTEADCATNDGGSYYAHCNTPTGRCELEIEYIDYF